MFWLKAAGGSEFITMGLRHTSKKLRDHIFNHKREAENGLDVSRAITSKHWTLVSRFFY